MVEVTLEITQYCENECEYCSSNATKHGKDMSWDVARLYLEVIAMDYDIERINISGGEPLSNPDFYLILKTSEYYTDNVWVYTNALKNIIYNTDIIKEINIEANVCMSPGKEHYIPMKVDRVHLLKLVKQGRAKNLPEGPEITVSRNFWDEGACDECNHILVQASGRTVKAPCKKEYK